MLEEKESIKVIFENLPSYEESKTAAANQLVVTANRKVPSYSSKMWEKNYRHELSNKYLKPFIRSKERFETTDKTIGFEEQITKQNKNFFMNQYHDESSTNIDEFQHGK